MGRPDKLTAEVADSIVTDVREGVPMHRAARLAGIDPATLHRWMAAAEQVEKQADEQGEEAAPEEMRKFREFRNRVLRARDELLREAVRVKHRHMLHKNPKISGPASTFVLTQMFSSDFSAKTQVEATGKDGGPIAVQGSVQVGGAVALRPLVDLELLQQLTRAQTEAVLAVEAERQAEEEATEEGAEDPEP